MLHPDLYIRFGLNPPRGILLHGPPGTGKTALARAVASSAGCSCIVVNGPELSSAYHGETEERLRGVFTEARKRSPCIVVLDEVDALCPRRDGGEGGEVERRVVATLLTLMDGMSHESLEGERVFVVAATNRPNSIDPALRRPGRFDREIEVGELTSFFQAASKANILSQVCQMSKVVEKFSTLCSQKFLTHCLKRTSLLLPHALMAMSVLISSHSCENLLLRPSPAFIVLPHQAPLNLS